MASTKSKGQELDMTQDALGRLILPFTIPLLLGNFFQQLYYTVDSIIVGQFIGKHAPINWP